MTTVRWIKCQGDAWCSLRGLNLSAVKEHGVYIIWHGGPAPKVVYVGQGDVAARLAQHRQTSTILSHESKGTLYVTWAAVPAVQRDGIERYLADIYLPLVGDCHPIAMPIAVNSPFG